MADKATLYVDIDDEITAIIDKVASSKGKVVALVLPKRATAMQSLVNMKLLKRASEEAGKNLVLVTNEAGLMPLAGAAGLHVAATPTSKPAIPKLVDSEEPVEDIDEPADDARDFDARADEDKPIGEVVGLGAAAVASEAGDEEPIELDNSEPAAPVAAAKLKQGRDKKLKVPNFKKFRVGVIIAILALIGLGVLIYLALVVWPHATVKIYTNQQNLPLSFTAKLDTGASAVDPATGTIPATAETQQKNYSQTVPATGQKDEGTPATGSVTMNSGCVNGPPPADIQAGTGVSTNNLTYITQGTAHFSSAQYNSQAGCFEYYSNSVDITAQQPGTNYNVSSATFSVSGSSATATGSASGGTSNIVRVVQQSDIDSAKQQLANQNQAAIKQTLNSELQQAHLMPLDATFTAIPSNVDSSANVGDQADNLTVTETVTYVLFGVHESDLTQLIKANAAQQMNSSQGILKTGLGSANFQLDGTPSTQSANLKISTTAIIGPKLDTANLKKQVEGKQAGDIRSELGKQQGISRVEVDLSPFWVGSVPKNPDKITIDFVKNSNSAS